MSVYFNASNAFPTPCFVCKKVVPANIGVNRFRDENGKWWVYHKECLQQKKEAEEVAAESGARIEVELEEDGRVSVRNTSTGSKSRYTSIIASLGFHWDRDSGKSYGSFGAVPDLISALKDRYNVFLGKTLERRIDSRVIEAKIDIDEAKKRAAFIDSLLAKRNLSLYEYQQKSIRWLAPRTTALLGHSPGLGKAQPVDAKVLTPTGWKLMGAIKVGDEVIGSDGCGKKVLGVFPQGERDIYRVTFSDGSSTECDYYHLWTVWRRYGTNQGGYQGLRAETHTLKEIVEYGLKDKSDGKRKNRLDVVKPVQFAPADSLPLDPYLVGLLLGDGGLSNENAVYMSTTDQEIVEAISSRIPLWMGVKKQKGKNRNGKDNVDYRIAGNKGQHDNVVLHELRKIGLAGTDSFTKFIPHAFRFASIRDRVSLLQGLIDTDGYVMPCGTVIYYTVSNQLADDVVFLVRSLGGIVKRSLKQPKYKYKGETKNGAPCHVLTLALPNEILPCRLARKRALLKPRTKYHAHRFIESVEHVGKKQAQCILIDAADHLYVTDDFILTHNTVITLAALQEKAPVVIVSPKNAVSVWLREMVSWRPDYGSARKRYRAGLLYLEPDKGIRILEGMNGFEWPRPGEVAILGYSILPLTPAEHEEALELLNEWEKRGQPETFSYKMEGEEEEEEIGPAEIKAAARMADMKPVTAPPQGTVLIFDECHLVKARAGQRQSNRTRRFLALAEYVRNNGGRTWGLTGTPLLNEPTELWAVLRAVGSANEIFGSKKLFDKLFKRDGKGWEASPHVAQLLRKGMLRFNKRDVLKELPPKHREHVSVEISPEAMGKLDKLLADVEQAGEERLAGMIEREQLKAIEAEEKRKAREAKKKKRKKAEEDFDGDEGDEVELTEAEQLRKAQELAKEAAADGYIPFEKLSEIRTVVAKAKIPALFRIVEEYVKRGEPIVVFADHIEPVQFIYEKFGREQGGWALITGAISARKRGAIEESFQRKKEDGGTLIGIAATIGAAGTALTLTRARTAIFIEENWVPAINLQAMDRIHRIGQFHAVTIKVLVARHPIDEMIADANARKIKLTEDTVDAAAMDPENDIITIADELEGVKQAIEHITERQLSALEDEHEAAVAAAYERERPTETPGTFVTPPKSGTVQLPGSPAFTSGGGMQPTREAPRREREPGEDEDMPDLTPKPFQLPTPRDPKRIAPKTPDQIAAAKVLLQALEFGGFRQGDTFGPSIAAQLKQHGGLTEASATSKGQWVYALKIARDLGAKIEVVRTPGNERRKANNATERWAVHGLEMLIEADRDHAREQNGEGFSKFDGGPGRDLYAQAMDKGLTEAQWAYAIRLANRYRRQIGNAPGVNIEENPVAEWHVIVTEGIRGTRDHGVIGNDDIQARTVETKNGSVPEVLLFPKVLYTPEEAAQWTEHHAMPWIRVEG